MLVELILRDRILDDKIRREPAIALMNIIKILSIGKFTLAIYYTKSDCYKYSIIDDYGTVLEQDSICYTSEAAEREGREAINIVSS
ncbi:MAG: hypothetical protein AB4372_16005 [Xenococcus sp. (in: cyanobacteria)]